jgi:hypothetical protein
MDVFGTQADSPGNIAVAAVEALSWPIVAAAAANPFVVAINEAKGLEDDPQERPFKSANCEGQMAVEAEFPLLDELLRWQD